MDVRWLLGIMGLWLIITLWGWFTAWRKGRLKYSVKTSVNSLRGVVHLIFAMYFMVGCVNLLPPIINWVETYLVANPNLTPPNLTYYIITGTPMVYATAIIGIAAWFMYKGIQPWWKYTEQELVWQTESQKKGIERLHKLFPLKKQVKA